MLRPPESASGPSPVKGIRNVPGRSQSVADTAAVAPLLAGQVLTDDAALEAFATDWGHIVTARPRVVIRPVSTTDVCAVVRFAAERGVPVSARGAGHSPFGQSQAADGIILDMTSMRHLGPVNGDRLTVDAGVLWRDVLATSLPHDLTPPVLTDYLGITVGGTLSVGGIGGASRHYGAQVDTVESLEVVDGHGEAITCSAEEASELFDTVRGGLGQCGVITKATLRLLPAQARARRLIADCGSARALIAAQCALADADQVDYLEGLIVLDPETGRWVHLLETATFYSGSTPPPQHVDDLQVTEVHDTSYLDFLDRLRPGVAARQADGSWFHPHPWLNLFLPDDAVEEFVTATLARTAPADLGPSGLILLYPLRAARVRAPMLRMPAGDTVWLFAILRTGLPQNPAHTERMLQLNAALREESRLAGGCVYPSNAVPMSAVDWQVHFGPAWGRMSAAKKRFDPTGILATGQGVFPR